KAEAPSPTPLESFFLQPDRVQIFIADLSIPLMRQQKETRPSVGYFLLKGNGLELSAQDRQTLAQNWIAPEKVVPKEPTLCGGFNPDVALRFWKGTSWVDVVLCFGCSKHLFYDAKGKSMNGGTFQDFSALVKLAKSTFPQEQFP
ncbi:MAG TPA: hypothetical protein VF815_36360, partial [Myxococcaceae bacterium]